MLKAAIDKLAMEGTFNAGDVLMLVMEGGITSRAEDVEAALNDLCDIGHLRALGGTRLAGS
jgi:hypothetical protein